VQLVYAKALSDYETAVLFRVASKNTDTFYGGVGCLVSADISRPEPGSFFDMNGQMFHASVNVTSDMKLCFRMMWVREADSIEEFVRSLDSNPPPAGALPSVGMVKLRAAFGRVLDL
jgi:hypothetical protein